MSGRLFVVATPLGNLRDLSFRSVETLKAVQAVVCEDTRHSRHLLENHGIVAPTLSLPAFAEKERTAALVQRLLAGDDLALVSDAGTPAISDPGEFLVAAALAAGAIVVPIPGPSAVVTALCASGLPTSRFHFLGFLPRQESDALQMLEELRALRATLILYEAPGRVGETLVRLQRVLGNRKACVARELTKLHEEFLRGTLSELHDIVSARTVLGEVVLLVEGAMAEGVWSEGQVREALSTLLKRGERTKSAALEVARLSGWSSQAVYKLALTIEKP